MANITRETYDGNGNLILTENIIYDDAPILKRQAQAALDKTEISVSRIVEAVSAGHTTFTTADVVDYMAYRAALRVIVRTGVGPLPVQPAYPSGT